MNTRQFPSINFFAQCSSYLLQLWPLIGHIREHQLMARRRQVHHRHPQRDGPLFARGGARRRELLQMRHVRAQSPRNQKVLTANGAQHARRPPQALRLHLLRQTLALRHLSRDTRPQDARCRFGPKCGHAQKRHLQAVWGSGPPRLHVPLGPLLFVCEGAQRCLAQGRRHANKHRQGPGRSRSECVHSLLQSRCPARVGASFSAATYATVSRCHG